MSRVVEVVDSIYTNGQSVKENPTTNQVKKVVTHVLIHWNPVRVCVHVCVCVCVYRERMNLTFVKQIDVVPALEYCGKAEAVCNLKR